MSQLYVDNIKNRTGGAIGAPSGAVVTGIVTATKVSASSSITAASFYGGLKVGDDDGTKTKSVKLGDDDDLTLYYDGRQGYVTSYIESDQMIIRPKSTPSDTYIDMIHGGSVRLFHGSNTRLSTSATGVGISGEFSVSGNTELTGTGSLKVPVGTTAQRPTPAAGMFRYNSTEGKFEGYTTEWGEIGGAAGITTTASSPSANTVVTLDLSSAQHHELNLSAGITTITCSGGSIGDSHSVLLIQPTSGIATVGFSTYFLFPSGATPAMSEGGGKIDLLSFVAKQVGAGGTQLLASAGLNYQ